VFGEISLGIVGANCARSDLSDAGRPLLSVQCLKNWVAVSRPDDEDGIRDCLALGAAGVVAQGLGRPGVSAAIDLALGWGVRPGARTPRRAGGDAPAGAESRVVDWPLRAEEAEPRRVCA
jgi:hypothetical protein